MLIGSIVIAVLMVVGAYLGSHYYYGETVVVEIPEPLAYTPSQHYTPPALDFSELPEPIETKQTQLESEIMPPEELSIEDFLAELTEAEKQTFSTMIPSTSNGRLSNTKTALLIDTYRDTFANRHSRTTMIQ